MSGHSRSSRWPCRGRAEAERGAALVEFALVFPILALFLFGIVEFGLALNDYQSIRQGAREGARQAVVNEFSGGNPSCQSGVPQNDLVCLTRARTGVSGAVVHIVVLEGADGRRGTVEVCVAKELSSYSGLMEPFIGGRVLSSSIEMRIERDIDLEPGTYGNPAPAGRTWGELCT